MCAYLCVRMGEHEVCAAEESKKKMNEETYFYLAQIPGKSKTINAGVCSCKYLKITSISFALKNPILERDSFHSLLVFRCGGCHLETS